MRKLLATFLLAPALTAAALLPEALGEFERKSLEPFQPSETEVFSEFGFEEGEQARYATADGQSVEIWGCRFYDDTSAFAAFQWLRPADGEFIEYGERASQSGNLTVIHFGNYVVQMRGTAPLDEYVELMLTYLPRVQLSPDPPVLKYIPKDQLIANSQRHILGPEVLGRLAPEIPPSVAAFHFGTEAQFARYRFSAGELKLLVFSYPSSQIARGQIEEFNQLPAVMAKRSGPLIAVVVSPASADDAERLLAKIRYAAEVTVSPRTPRRHDSVRTLIIDILILCAILIGLMIFGGVMVAAVRILAGRYAPDSIFAPSEELDIIRLNIERR